MTSIARAEPAYVDQVLRRLAFEADHPHVQITYHGPYWEARIPHGVGETVISRYELRGLLDTLERHISEHQAADST